MLPWDFGIINAIRKEIEFAIFPSIPPKELQKKPYLVFELKNVMMGKNLTSRVEFTITIVDENEISGTCFNIVHVIDRLISKELSLSQGKFEIGKAKIKLTNVEQRRNNLILNFVGILKMVAIYEDEH